MKKLAFISVLPLVILIAWCWKDKIDITDTNIDVETCDKYFELMDCIIENDWDENYTEEMRDELRQEVKDMQSEWELLDDDVLAEQCSNELSKFESIENRLEEIWCSIK